MLVYNQCAATIDVCLMTFKKSNHWLEWLVFISSIYLCIQDTVASFSSFKHISKIEQSGETYYKKQNKLTKAAKAVVSERCNW